MNPNKNIKVIKSAQRVGASGVAEGHVQDGEQARHFNRDVASRVGSWVKEFKQRRSADPKRAFASLFVEPTPALNQSS
jgi:hypothetical protein